MKKWRKMVVSAFVITALGLLFFGRNHPLSERKVSAIHFDTIHQYGLPLDIETQGNAFQYLTLLFQDKEKQYLAQAEETYLIDVTEGAAALQLLGMKELIEISNIDGLYFSIAYETISEEFVILHYLKDGTINCSVKMPLAKGDSLVHRLFNEKKLVEFDGKTETVYETFLGK